MDRRGRKGDFSTLFFDDFNDLQENVLLDLVEMDPVGGFGERIDEKVQGRGGEGVEIDDQRLPGIDFRMVLEHFQSFSNNGFHFRGIIVTDTNGFIDPAVFHPGGIFHGDGGEGRIGNVEWSFVEGPDARQPPADFFHGAFDFPVRGSDPLADRKGPVQVDGQSAKEIGQQILGREANGDSADTTERQHPGNAVSQGLQDNQRVAVMMTDMRRSLEMASTVVWSTSGIALSM